MINQLTKRQINKTPRILTPRVQTPRYLTKQTFKDILKESDLDKRVILNLKNTILNTIKGIDSLKDDTNKTYIDSFNIVIKGGGFTNTMIVSVDDIDSVIYILMEIGFKEGEIRVEDVRSLNPIGDSRKNYDVEVVIMTNRHEFIKRLIDYGVMGKVIPKWWEDTI